MFIAKPDSFVYVWTDHSTNKIYVGIHKGHPNDSYISSSKSFMEEYKKRPYDFTRQVIAEGIYEDMIALETAILRSANAKIDETYYNLHNGDGKFYNKGHTEETKKKLSGRKHSDETKEKLRQIRLAQPDPRLGKKHSPETIEKMRQSKMGKRYHTKQVTIDGITYNSYKEAAEAVGCVPDVIRRRIKKGIYHVQ